MYSSSLPSLILAQSLEQIKEVYKESQEYKKRMEELAEQYEKETQIEVRGYTCIPMLY